MAKLASIPETELLDLLEKGIPTERIAALYRIPESTLLRQLAAMEREKQRQEALMEARMRSAMGGRPFPSDELMEIPGSFAAGTELLNWVRATFLSEDGPLYNPDHDHLAYASLALLWTSAPYKKHGRLVAGLAEMPSVQGNAWVRARIDRQLIEWFGEVPTFLITLSAPIAAALDDANFCSLVEHELYHCGQAVDEFGSPKFNAETGMPNLAIKGHDVEEHLGVVRRYGTGAAAAGVAELVAAASRSPSVAMASISQACGTCLRSSL